MSKKKILFIVVALLVLVGIGGGYYLYSNGSDDAALAGTGSVGGADSVLPGDHVMGRADAPVTMIEYFAQACSVCARFDQDVFPLLKAKYIDTGKVRYVMRLFPLFPVDGPSYKLDLCVPPSEFFHSVDLLFRNQPQWDSGEFPVADPHAGLLRMARILGLSDAQADACMNSTKQDAAINQVAQDATARYQPEGTPTFVIDFQKIDFPNKSWAEAQAAIDAALAKHAK